MNESPDGADEPAQDPVGTVAEEAAKLAGAMADWAKEHGGTGWASGLGSLAHDVDEHVAHGEDCRYCPLCRGIRAVRATSPEVREHLAAAISSLAQAATAYLTTDPSAGRQADVERIDVTEDWPEDGPE